MNNNSFWDSYKAKCAEKGLPPHYESEEEFSKAMTQPSKPYSTDDLVAHKEERKPLKAMSEEALRNLLRLAFLAGVESVNAPEPEDVTQEMAMELLNDVISQCKSART